MFGVTNGLISITNPSLKVLVVSLFFIRIHIHYRKLIYL
nr:MAG TPA: hypothetical protein [Caudoviricetes sp.]